jgi:hypothetical protein
VISTRRVIAYPDFTVSAARHGATNFLRIAPNKLCVMAAHARTLVSPVVVVRSFRSPSFDDLLRQVFAAGDIVEVLSPRRFRRMVERAFLNQRVGPILRGLSELLRLDERR